MKRLAIILALVALAACVDRSLYRQMRAEPVLREPPISALLARRDIPPTREDLPGLPGGYLVRVWGSALPLQQLVDFYFGNFFERYQLHEVSPAREGFDRSFFGNVGEIHVVVGISFRPPADPMLGPLIGPLAKAPAGTQSYAQVLVSSD